MTEGIGTKVSNEPTLKERKRTTENKEKADKHDKQEKKEHMPKKEKKVKREKSDEMSSKDKKCPKDENSSKNHKSMQEIPVSKQKESDKALRSASEIDASKQSSDSFSYFDLVPVQCNGLALGLTGLANIVLNLHSLWFKVYGPGQNEVRALAGVILMPAVLNQMLYFGKVISNPAKTWRTDFCTHTAMGGQVLSSTLAFFSVTVLRLLPQSKVVKAFAPLGVWFSALVLQPLTMMRFYNMVLKDRGRVSVLFFAPSVSVATLAATGGAVAVDKELLAYSLLAGVCIMLILWPVCLWRALRDRSDTATPAIGQLQVPCSFCCMAYFAVSKVPEDSELLGPEILGDVLFGFSVAGVLATMYCSLRRWRALYASWPSPAWAAFTFPCASSTNVALSRAMTHQHPAYTAYALGLCAIVVPIIVVINAKHLSLMSRPPSRRMMVARKEKKDK